LILSVTKELELWLLEGWNQLEVRYALIIRHLKQRNTFNYLGYNIPHEGEKGLNIKVANFVKVLGIINKIFIPSLVSRHTRIRIYKTLARPVLSYGNKAWTI
jgi:hypothetical protein